MGTLFWWVPWLEGGILKDRFSCLFYLSDNKLVTVADMFSLGRGREERIGNGVRGCWLGRKNLRGNVVHFYYQLFCRQVQMTGEFDNFMPLQNTTLLVCTTS